MLLWLSLKLFYYSVTLFFSLWSFSLGPHYCVFISWICLSGSLSVSVSFSVVLCPWFCFELTHHLCVPIFLWVSGVWIHVFLFLSDYLCVPECDSLFSSLYLWSWLPVCVSLFLGVPRCILILCLCIPASPDRFPCHCVSAHLLIFCVSVSTCLGFFISILILPVLMSTLYPHDSICGCISPFFPVIGSLSLNYCVPVTLSKCSHYTRNPLAFPYISFTWPDPFFVCVLVFVTVHMFASPCLCHRISEFLNMCSCLILNVFLCMWLCP